MVLQYTYEIAYHNLLHCNSPISQFGPVFIVENKICLTGACLICRSSPCEAKEVLGYFSYIMIPERLLTVTGQYIDVDDFTRIAINTYKVACEKEGCTPSPYCMSPLSDYDPYFYHEPPPLTAKVTVWDIFD